MRSARLTRGSRAYSTQQIRAILGQAAAGERNVRSRLLDPVLLSDSEDAAEPACETEDEGAEEVFRALHTLSSGYRDITVDYYLGGMSVKEQLAERYSLTETTVKWRLNVARERIRERMDGQDMDKIYKRINWETTTCSGSFDVNAYLSTQTARAICAACYEEPLSIEEISMKTGLPTDLHRGRASETDIRRRDFEDREPLRD